MELGLAICTANINAHRRLGIAAAAMLLIVGLLWTGAAAFAAEQLPVVFDVNGDPGFAGYHAPLVAFLKAQHAHGSAHVCILGEQSADGTKSAWVIWREGRKMLLWDGGDASMVGARRVLDLRRDVVATDAAVGGSTYLVTRAWVDEQMRLCNLRGITLSVRSKQR
jgi:hypothetical protein